MQMSCFTLVCCRSTSCSRHVTEVAPTLNDPMSAITDLNDDTGVLRLDSPTLRLDHCDLLLDAIDAQLVQLQVCNFHYICWPHLMLITSYLKKSNQFSFYRLG